MTIDKDNIKNAILAITNDGKIHPDIIYSRYLYDKEKFFDGKLNLTRLDEVFAFVTLGKIWISEDPKIATKEWIEAIK